MNLESLRDLVGDARVVGIGESAHWVRAYRLLRHRMLRFLVEQMGFTVFAMESGFSEGRAVDAWIHGGPGELAEVAERGLTYRFGQSREMRDQLAWMRAVNTAGGSMAYSGLDLPGDLASMLPALDSLDRYCADVDPEANELLEAIRAQAVKYAGPQTMPAFAAYGKMSDADRDRLTVLLAALAARFDARRPFYLARGSRAGTDAARHELRLAVLLDQALRAQLAGDYATNVRDAAMAETVTRLLERDGARIVIGAANSHLQRVPVEVGPTRLPVLGTHLAADLGDAYVAVGVTAIAGRTSTRHAAPDDPVGVEGLDVELAPPVEGSAEAIYGAGVIDLRTLRSGKGPERIRTMDGWAEVPVNEAFDLLVTLPTT